MAFSILFMRNGKGQYHDDSITISRGGIPHTFVVEFQDRSVAVNRFVTRFTATRKEVIRYVDTILSLQVYDDDPFEFIQVSPPMYPAILFKQSQVHTHTARIGILNMLRHTLYNWPRRLS